MSKLTLDEAIKHCLEVAEKNENDVEVYEVIAKNHKNTYSKLTAIKYATDCAECAADHRQLAEWLTNYKEAMRLLKSAIDEWHIVCEWGKCGEYCGWYVGGQCSQKWSGEAEALKLIES